MNKKMVGTYLDTNVIIYLVEGNAALQQKVGEIIARATNGDARLVTSEITIGECMLGACKKGEPALIREYEEILQGGLIELIPVDKGVLESAAAMGAKHRLKLIDAIHVATAVAVGCDTFITNDMGIRAGNGLRVVQIGDVDNGND